MIDSDDYLYLFKPNAGRIFYFWGDENPLGDVNGDGAVNGVDVAPFVAVLIAGEYDPTADVNDDGNANGMDIGAFVDIIVNGGFFGMAEPIWRRSIPRRVTAGHKKAPP